MLVVVKSLDFNEYLLQKWEMLKFLTVDYPEKQTLFLERNVC